MSSIKSRAVDALVDEDYERAIELFDQASRTDPKDFEIYIGRASAYLKLEDYVKAVNEATKAVQLEPTNYRAYLKKGEAAFKLEEYETARKEYENALQHGAPEGKCRTMIRNCQAELDDEQSEEEVTAPVASSTAQQPPLAAQPTAPALPTTAPTTAPQESPSEEPEPKYRHQFFQTQSVVEIAVLAKNLTADRLKVEIKERQLVVTILDAQGQQEYKLDVDLHGAVDPSASKYEILGTKVEIRLRKAEAVHWPSLEAGAGPKPAKTFTPTPAQAPAYPTSFKRRPVDWDKLENELKNEEKDEKLEGDAALQKLFQGIYANADEDTRRAMNKSFQESNGTVLSTNWKDVGSKKVEYKAS